MSTITRPRNSVNAKSRPLAVTLLLTIRETDYAVTVIAPGPDNIKAYRLEKLSGDRETYDLAHTNDGLVVCDCKSYVASHEGTISTCKHGSALVLMGLLPKPCCIANAKAAPLPVAKAPAPRADRWEGLAEGLEVEASADAPCPTNSNPETFRDLPPASESAPESLNIRDLPPARVVPFDADFYRAQNAVAERRALWLSHRHLHAPAKGVASTDAPADIRLIDDDGTPFETPREMDARHRAEHAAAVAALMTDNPFLSPCCPDDEPQPCQACLTNEGPGDLSDDAWDDGHVWSTSDGDPDSDAPPARMTFTDWIAHQAAGHAKIGGERHAWLARQIAKLAERARFLDADSPDAFDDRLDAHLDAVHVAAEARQAARCC